MATLLIFFPSWGRMLRLVLAAGATLLLLSVCAHAQSASAVFSGR